MESVARTWNNGAVIRSWLLELCEEAFHEEGSDLGDVADHVAGGSTGTWTVREALEQEVPVPIIYQALAERFDSRNEGRFSRRLANRLRYGSGATRSRGARTRSETGRRGELSQVRAHFRSEVDGHHLA